MASTHWIVIGDDQQAAPLTEAQSGLWYVQRIDPANPILNGGQYIDISGPLDVGAFRKAVDQMVSETDALALRFFETIDGPRQIVDLSTRPWLEIVDLSQADDPAAQALAAIRADTATPVDLEHGRVAAFRLYMLGTKRFFWYERIHHLAIDGYGMVLVTNRVAELYSAARGGPAAAPPLGRLSLALDDDAAYRVSEKRDVDRAYWHEALQNLPEIGGMAQGRPVSSDRFHRETLAVPLVTANRLRAFADAAKITWPDALVGLVAAYCRRFIAAPEIIVGVPHMGRLGSAAARVPCMLMNVLPVRVASPDDEKLTDYLVGISRQLIRARRHGRYRSEQIRRDLGLIGGQRRLYGPIINLQPFNLPPRFQGLDAALNILGAGSVDDITFTFRGDAREHLTFEVDSNPNLYSAEETRAHARRLMAFLERAFDAQSLADIPLASPDEAQRFVFDVNRTEHAVPDTTLTALIEATMSQFPAQRALVFGQKTLTYAELDRRSAALAAHLAGLGAGPETIVAVALPRSFDLVIALVATLRAGAAYLPLDLDHPQERIARILRSARPVCVLCQPKDAPRFDGETPAVTSWPTEGDAPKTSLLPGDMAYVIYTSGSTGEPKGVVIEHRAIVNRLDWMREHYGFGPHDRILQKTPATFDVSVWEFFLPLMVGATLVIAPPGAHRDPTAIAALIRDHEITTAHFVPSMLSAFLASPASKGLSMARVFCSGEELTSDQRNQFHQTVRSELHNLYGPTEAAVDVSFWPAGPDDRSSPVPIGFPVWNTRLYVLDDNMQPVPAGVVGHLVLAGRQLARGYLGRPDLTADRFVDDPFVPGQRMYRTGDVARFRDDGAVVFLGRSDHQVKIRGLRIELGEIEAAIMSSGLVLQAGVVAREDRPGDRRIVAYLVAGVDFKQDALRAHVAAQVPDYMVPAAFIALDALPITANGKLDRAALPAPDFLPAEGRAAETASETTLARLFAEVLGVNEPVGAEDDFFRLGGDSLQAVLLMLRVAESFGHDPGLGALFEHPTVAALAALLDKGNTKRDSGLNPLIRLNAGDDRLPPLFVVHPAGGIAWGYRHLARALAPRPVYGLQSPALDPGLPLPASLEALADEYVARIMAARPGGPYHLAGWSVGGIIAQAMAVRLCALGKAVGLVALLDSYPAECWRAEPEPDETAALRALLAVAGYDPGDHPDLMTREAIVGFLRQGESPLGNLPNTALDGVVRVVLDTNRLVRGHHHARFDGAITHVRAALDHEGKSLTPALWLAHAAALDRVDAPFLHPQLTTPAAVAVIAPKLRRRLAAFDALLETA